MRIVLLIVLLGLSTSACAHEVWKNKSYGFNHFADAFSISLNNDNVLGVNRNGESMQQWRNFCVLRPTPPPAALPKSYAWKNFADNFQLDLDNSNMLIWRRNGTSMHSFQSFCQLRSTHD